MHSPLPVLIVAENVARAERVEAALLASGCAVVGRRLLGDGVPRDLCAAVHAARPDVLVVDVERADRALLESVAAIARDAPRPIAIFVDQSDAETIRAAVEAGVSAYVVDGFQAGRVRPVVELAIARFAALQALRDELAAARSSLVDRKLIERAKGILMKHRGMAEEDAFRALRKMAMDRKVRLAAVAREVVVAAELLR